MIKFKFNFHFSFLVPIVLLSIGLYSIFCINDNKQSFENRQLESCSFNKILYLKFYKYGFTKLKKCVDDHLIINSYVVILSHMIKKQYGKSIDPNIFIGKNGWQFLSNANDITQQYRGINRYSEIDLRKIVNNIAYYNYRLKLLGSNLYIVVIPTQHVIYSEFLPTHINVVNNERRVHQLMHALKNQHSDVPILYLDSCLMDKKNNGLIFNRSEGHWTELGALFAFECISKFINLYDGNISVINPNHYLKINDSFNFPPIAYNEILPKIIANKKFNFVNSLENFDSTFYIRSENYKYFPKTLIIGDSFMENSRQFIADSFHNVHEIHSQQQGLGFSTIQNDPPKNVIYIFTERFLNNVFYDISEIPPNIFFNSDFSFINSKFNIDRLEILSKKIFLSGWINDSRGVEPHRLVILKNNIPIYQSNTNRSRPDLTNTVNLLGFDFEIKNDDSKVESLDIVSFYYDNSSEKIRIFP